jgi:hypothetical protein
MCTNFNESKLLGTKTKFNQGYFGRDANIISKYKNNNQSIKTSISGRKSRKNNTRHSSKLKINSLKKT